MLQPIKNLLEGNLIKYVAVAFQLLVTVLMLIPTSGVSYMDIPQSDKFLHMVIYLILFVVWAFAWKVNPERKWLLWTLVVLLTIYGIVIELIQDKYIDSRTADFWDVMANSVGILFGMVVFYKLKRRIELKK
jgi:VanZ family protein